MTNASPPRLAVRGLEKWYGTHRALAALTLELPAATIHGVLGENGAGKSTLVRIVAGALRPDAGMVAIDGVPLPPGDPGAARAAGIGVVFQHFALVGALSVAENLFLGCPEMQSRFISPQRLAAAATALARRHGFDIGDPSARCETLPVGVQARIEILRALSGPVRVLLLDEPTAVLTPAEIAELFASLRRLRDAGVLIVLVTHKLGEALDVCDRVSVMRAGELVTTVTARDLSPAELARLMIGADEAPAAGPVPASAAPVGLPAEPATPPSSVGDPALVVHGVSTGPAAGRIAVHDVALALARGEICGVAGVDGNGQDELAAALYGLVPRSGEVRLAGTLLPPGNVVAAHDAGAALIPGDRRQAGLALALSVWENALLSRPLLARYAPRGILDVAAARVFAAELARRYRVVYSRLEQPVADLSGGNQQRVVIARTLAVAPVVLIAVNPTRGLDIAATAHVHSTLVAAARAGTAVLLISTDLDELLTLCRRLFALYRGRLYGPVGSDERARLSALMAGVAA